MKRIFSVICLIFILNVSAHGIDINKLDKLNSSQINTALSGKKLSGFYLVQKTRYFETYFRNKDYEFNHGGKLSKGKWKTKGNKICIRFDDEFSYECSDLFSRTNNGERFYYYVTDNKVYAGSGIIGNAKQISSNSKDVTLSCSSQKGLKASIIINENSNKIIFNGFRVKTKIQWGTKVKFKHPDPNKFNPKLSNDNEVVLDRVTGELTFPLSSSDFDHIFTKIFICKKSQALF
ncbi:hypothetical protein [Candidatus Pelagibacter sp. HIMB1506]|uniref:hypothetical protein n=1 Tax=Candidatus Pelagibacter sp. HIMB1506 TaxID=3413337 RepID=UPI003F826FE5